MKSAKLWMSWGTYYMSKIKPARGQVYEYGRPDHYGVKYDVFRYVILNVDKRHHIVEVLDMTNNNMGTLDYKAVLKESKYIETIDVDLALALYDG